MSLSLSLIRRLPQILRKLSEYELRDGDIISPVDLVQKRIVRNQAEAAMFLRLASRSNNIQQVYRVRSPRGSKPVVGIFDYMEDIPKVLYTHDFERFEFQVTENLIDEVYKYRAR